MAKSPDHKTILAIRFSAMGDVAMTIPVMKQVLDAHPGVTIVFVTNKNWSALCEGIPRLVFFPADLKGEHKGLKGLYKLFRAIRKAHPAVSAVADLHHVLRSRIVRTFYKFSGIRVAVIDKGRAGKKALTRKENKIFRPLKTTIDRYRDVFAALGLSAGDTPGTLPQQPSPGKTQIGIAPFATYLEKTYPLEKMEQVIEILTRDGSVEILLFGGGKEEVTKLENLAQGRPQLKVMAGKYSLNEELRTISGLSVMVSMDSANMHLASLYGVPVVSVWGATHPYAGFMGFGQKDENAAQIELYCRPCSVFGNKPCFRGDHACMQQLAPEIIVGKVRETLAGRALT
ncbi:glycosyltransferase family 9 protein [Chitinophaga sp. GCM10012297]|uniref:Glycosyltransferase family 9 protein n=1 Tax=Chitinophaga chungangae TaxID=2821488 RepID=A0ABS3Y8G5_9BACT|nr:glycosyltransferase family 9 protein [Chitinophaga chungangae]MBO9150974.1 glycosyltransferase family 9 protein [Chitinophaga chungangae]